MINGLLKKGLYWIEEGGRVRVASKMSVSPDRGHMKMSAQTVYLPTHPQNNRINASDTACLRKLIEGNY